MSKTTRFDKAVREEKEIRNILTLVHEALKAKGYDPINQMVGYLISGDPTYITSKDNARSLITQVDRDEVMEVLLNHFLFDKEAEK